jgi:hypothetical protein
VGLGSNPGPHMLRYWAAEPRLPCDCIINMDTV